MNTHNHACSHITIFTGHEGWLVLGSFCQKESLWPLSEGSEYADQMCKAYHRYKSMFGPAAMITGMNGLLKSRSIVLVVEDRAKNALLAGMLLRDNGELTNNRQELVPLERHFSTRPLCGGGTFAGLR